MLLGSEFRGYYLRMNVRWRKSALIAQSALLFYFQICMWLPLDGWNGAEHFPVQTIKTALLPVAIGLGTALLLFATLLQVRWLMWVGVIGHFAWFTAQAATLWPPYVFGASPDYAAMYGRVWGRNTKLLPSWGNHLAPDAMHFFIQLLLGVTLATAFFALLKTSANTSDAANKSSMRSSA